MKHIFLAGGGSEKESRKIDEKFVETIDLAKPLAYIPNAAQDSKYRGCLNWFMSVMDQLKVKNIEMWESLVPQHPEDQIGGIYLGGGDTQKLLKELRKSGFTDYLILAVEAGVPIYGGSAGAIVLGKDIRTYGALYDSDSQNLKGLDIAFGYSIACHYKVGRSPQISKLVEKLDCKIIAIPEKSGVYLRGKELSVFGEEPTYIFNGEKASVLNPRETYRF